MTVNAESTHRMTPVLSGVSFWCGIASVVLSVTAAVLSRTWAPISYLTAPDGYVFTLLAFTLIADAFALTAALTGVVALRRDAGRFGAAFGLGIGGAVFVLLILGWLASGIQSHGLT